MFIATVYSAYVLVCLTYFGYNCNRWHLQRHQQEAHSHAALTPPSQSEKAPSDAAGEGAVTPSASRAKRAAPPVPTPTLCDVCGVQCDSASMLKA